MRTVSFQGTHLTSSQRRRIAEQQQVRQAFLNPHLAQIVDDVLSRPASPERYKKPKEWFLESTARGTPFVGDCFGF